MWCNLMWCDVMVVRCDVVMCWCGCSIRDRMQQQMRRCGCQINRPHHPPLHPCGFSVFSKHAMHIFYLHVCQHSSLRFENSGSSPLFPGEYACKLMYIWCIMCCSNTVCTAESDTLTIWIRLWINTYQYTNCRFDLRIPSIRIVM